MILPTKHLAPERALVTLGAEVLGLLSEPKTVSRLWEDFRSARRARGPATPVAFDWFVLAVDLLFAMGAVSFERGLLRKEGAR